LESAEYSVQISPALTTLAAQMGKKMRG